MENCGGYASRIGAWIVLVEIGETHRQMLNTRPNAPAVLPSYPRTGEQGTLLALEAQIRTSGAPGIAEVFTGIVYPDGVVSIGQNLRPADGKSAMLCDGIPARALFDQLAGLAADGGPIFSLGRRDPRLVYQDLALADQQPLLHETLPRPWWGGR